MAAVIDIVNKALSKIGDYRIISLDEDDKRANLANSIYGDIRDAEIQAHVWNFAKDRVMLPALAAKPAFGWSFQYQLPSDCLRVIQAGPCPAPIMDDLILGDTSSYTIEGTKLLTNHGPALVMIYLKRVDDTGIYPPVFVQALACRLAVELCEALTGSNSKRQLAWEEYQQALATARLVNAIQLPPQMIQDDTWMLAHEIGVF